MRKCLAILFAVMMTVCFAGCLEKKDSSPKKDSQKTENSGASEIELPEVWFD